jgi:hypothetical protein
MRTPAATARSRYGMSARTLGEAFDEFRRWPTPWFIAAVLAVALGARLWLGDWSTSDLWVAAAFLAAQTFVEWVVHVVVLHWRPRRVGPVEIDLYVAAKHRAHHADPRDPGLVFIPMRVLVLTLAAEVALWWAVLPRIELTLTALATLAFIGLTYEWTHFVVHTDHTPQTALLRHLRRNHRLHHFKNENYWFTVTNSVADRVLGTAPDKDAVPTSGTATDLLGAGERV